MNIVFRVDSSLSMGVGHIMRCLTLANKLDKNHEVTFICRDLIGNVISSIKYPVIKLPRNRNFKSNDLYLNWLGETQEKDAEQTSKVISNGVDVLIVDSYALDINWHKNLRKFTKKIIVIDDLANRKFDCDILLNQNLGIHKESYNNKVSSDCKLLLGCDYALLRQEFSKLRVQALKKRRCTKSVNNILISMGGSDESNLTYGILQSISNEFHITVVLGGASTHKAMIQQYAIGKNITVVVNAGNMAELMLDADLAIGAGGSTSWERCCLGLPTLLMVTENNQKTAAQNLEKLGAIKVIDSLSNDLKSLTSNLSLWKNMSEQAQKICDGRGVERMKI